MRSFSYWKALAFSNTAQDALIVMGGSFFSVLLGFIFVSIVARIVGPEDFGIFSTVVSYIVFLSAVLDLGVSQSLVRFVQQSKTLSQRKAWLSTGLAVTLVSSVVLGLLSTLIYHFFLKNLWHHPGGLSTLVWVTVIVITLSIFSLSLFQAIGKFWQRAIVDNVFSVVRLIFIGVVLLFASLNINGAIMSIVVGYLGALIVAWLYARNYLDFKRITIAKIKKTLRFSRWIGGISFFANLYGKLDVMMLAWLSTAYITGIYSAAARFILIFPLVTNSLNSVISPRFASFTKREQLEAYFFKSLLISVGLSCSMIILIIIAKPLILIPFSSAFADTIPVFQWLVVANLPVILTIPASNAVVYFFKKPQHITIVALLQLVGLIVLNLLLIPRYHSFGPVYSLLAMNLFGMLAQYSVYNYLRAHHPAQLI